MQEMVKCGGCSAMVPPQKSFCPNCGAPMELEEERRGNRGIENMAQTVIGVSLKQMEQTPVAPAPKPEPTPPPVIPAPVTPPPMVEKAAEKAAAIMPTPTPSSGGSSKVIFIVIGVVVVLFILLVLLIGGLFYTGILTITR